MEEKRKYGRKGKERYWLTNCNGAEIWTSTDETDYFCRECGAGELRVELAEGDYYVGPTYFCDNCSSMFTMG